MTSDVKQEDVGIALGNLHSSLRESEQVCARRLEELAGAYQMSESGQRVAMPPAEFSRFLDLTLRKIGRAACEGILNWERDLSAASSDVLRQSVPKKLEHVYFWPNYQYTFFGSGRASVAASSEEESRFGGGWGGGVGLSRDPRYPDRDEPIFDDLNSFWFNTLLRPEQYPVEEFRPGSTHGWFVHSPRAPDMLSVVVEGDSLSSSFPHTQIGDSVLITLPRSQVSQWAHLLKAQIANLRWKNPAEDLYPWPFPSDGTESENELRVALYEVWLTACFAPERFSRADDSTVSGLLQQFSLVFSADEAERQTQRIRVAIEQAVELYDPHRDYRFSAWHTIPSYEPFGGSVADRSLGTAMVLSSCPVDLRCLDVISSWTRTMYQALRQYEREVQGGADAQRAISSAFSHEIGHFSSALRRCTPPFSRIWPELRAKPTDLLFWKSPPFAIGILEEDRRSLQDWRLCALPQLFDGLLAMLEAWGDVGQLLKRMDLKVGQAVSFQSLVDGLQRVVPAVVAARRSKGKLAADTLESARKLEEDFLDLQRDGSPIRFEPTTSPATIILAPWKKSQQRQVDNIAVLVRLLAAVLSNALEHAADGQVQVEAIIRRRGPEVPADQLLVTIKNRRKPAGDGQPMTVGVSTKGVAESCLVQLEGALLEFPGPGAKDEEFARTQFWIPIEHSRGIPKPWIIQN